MATAEAIETGEQSTPGGHGHGDHDHPEWLAHHFDNADQQFDAGKLGIWLFLAQEVLFFTGLFVAYAVYRANHPEVFVGASKFLNPTLGALNTIVLLASSLAIAWAVRAAQRNEQKLMMWLHIFTLACAGLFMGVKVVEYSYKFDEGLYWAGSFAPTALVDGEGLNAQLPWVFVGSMLVGGLVMFGSWLMERFQSAAGVAIAAVGWTVMAYVFGSALAGTTVSGYHSSQVAAADAAALDAQNAAEAAEEAAAAPADGADAADAVVAEQDAELAAEKASKAAAASGRAASAIWSAGMVSFMTGVVTVLFTAVGCAAMYWFTTCFRGDRHAWGAVGLGLGGCIVGMAVGIVVARGVQLSTAHHGDDHAAHGDGHAGDHSSASHDSHAVGTSHEEAPHSEVGHSEDGHSEDEPQEKDSPGNAAPVAGFGATAATDGKPPVVEGAVTQGNFFSIYFAMTGVHALHIFAGIAVIAWIIGRIARGDFSPDFYGPVEFVGLYWHLVDLVWIYLFPLLYLIH
ncbi:MAG: cytochrome c oxidase subunit 3 [Planctomycetota bacterium]